LPGSLKKGGIMKIIFSPVYPVFYEIISEEQAKEFSRIIYFGDENAVEEAKGKITGLVTRDAHEEYLLFESGEEVRIDRIITINGKVGPAFDEYDAYALACLNCNIETPG
jgi:hypothetical protein